MKRSLLFLIIALLFAPLAWGQATKATAAAVVCAADGSSTQALAAAASRESYVLSNTSGGTVRIGFLATPSTADLTDSNSILLLAGQIFTDAAPSVYIGRVVCMNNAAGTATVYVIETRRLN